MRHGKGTLGKLHSLKIRKMAIIVYLPELIELLVVVELKSPSQEKTIIQVAKTHLERENETQISSLHFSS